MENIKIYITSWVILTCLIATFVFALEFILLFITSVLILESLITIEIVAKLITIAFAIAGPSALTTVYFNRRDLIDTFIGRDPYQDHE